MGSVCPSKAAPPQHELIVPACGAQHSRLAACGSSTVASTRRAASPYFSRTTSVSSGTFDIAFTLYQEMLMDSARLHLDLQQRLAAATDLLQLPPVGQRLE